MSSNSTRRPAGGKPKKPRKDFPLYAHAVGRWAKKCRGKTIYFTSWRDDPKGVAALEMWLEQKDDLLAGRTPATAGDDLAVRDLLNQFLTSKREQVESGELTARSFAEYLGTCENIASVFGRTRRADDLRPEDFEKLRKRLAKTNGPVRLGNEVQRVRSIFKFGVEAGWLDHLPRFGPAFKKPSRKVLRIERAKVGPRMLEADELRRLLDAAGVQLRAMILLGVNCGLGNSDCGRLEKRHLDLEGGWLNYARGKTGIPRRCKLWPETVAALQAALAERPRSKDKGNADRVFVTRYGNAWTRAASLTADGKVKPPIDAVCGMFGTLLKELGLKRPRIGFYTLRHVFQTIGSRTRDEVAVSAVMGHADESMASRYREGIDDERLEAVAGYVRRWLFADDDSSPSKEKPEICDPSDPCDPVPETGPETGRNGVASGAHGDSFATRENPEKTRLGSHGSQNCEPDVGPALRLYVG